MTLPFTLTWVALKYAAEAGAIQCRITLRSSLSIVATWVSTGGVIGLLRELFRFCPFGSWPGEVWGRNRFPCRFLRTCHWLEL